MLFLNWRKKCGNYLPESVSDEEGLGLMLGCAICGLDCSKDESPYELLTGTETGSV